MAKGFFAVGGREEATSRMSLERAYELLELRPGASVEAIQQAYKDMAAVWHPDRFGHSPRLRSKAEQRLKEINRAREVLEEYLKSGRRPNTGAPTAESLAEGATFFVLNAWRGLTRALKKATREKKP